MKMEPIQFDEHLLSVGITGGGKSYLIANYAATRPRVLKLDTKGEALVDLRDGKSPWAQVHNEQLSILQDFDALKRHDFKRRPYVIYVPNLDEQDDPSFLNEYFRLSFERNQNPKQPFVNWVDEIKDVSGSAMTAPKYFKAIYTKGRFFNNVIYGATQEPRHIHSLCMSQTTHFFTFDLPRREDRKRMSDNTGAPELMEPPTGYYFWYFRRGWRHAVKGILQG